MVHKHHYHIKPSTPHNKVPTGPAPGGASTQRKGLLNKMRERFSEKPATQEEVAQIKLNAEREVAKTKIYVAKKARPGLLQKLAGSQTTRSGSSRGRFVASREEPDMFSGGGSMFSQEPSYRGMDAMFGFGGEKMRKTKSSKTESFGSGLDDMFGL